MYKIIISFLLVLLFFVQSAYAYIGPGLGLGAIGTLLGLFAAIFLAIVGVIWYPFKRMISKFKSKTTLEEETTVKRNGVD